MVASSLCLLAGLALARSSGPPVDHVAIPWSEPSEPKSCTACHTGFADTGPGSLRLLGLPDRYEPDTEYELVVELLEPWRSRYGFELAVVSPELEQAGSLAAGDPSLTQIVFDASRQLDFLSQRAAGSLPFDPAGNSWSFRWLAPPEPAAPIAFYLCGVSGDGDGSPRNDRVYCRVEGLVPAGCALPPGRIQMLQLVKKDAALAVSWQADLAAVLGYRLYAVAGKAELPWANEATPAALTGCVAPTASDTSCGVALETATLFYQVVGVCGGGIEGPN